MSRSIDRLGLSLALCKRGRASPGALNLYRPVGKWNKDILLNALPLAKMGLPTKVITLDIEG